MRADGGRGDRSTHGSIYERPEYLCASAAHVGADTELAQAGGASLPVLRFADGTRRTVYGLPRPYGASESESLAALADELATSTSPLTAVLSPLEPGPSLARILIERGASCEGERGICVAELGADDPQEQFDRRARRAVRTALNRGAQVSIGVLSPWFGSFYRTAMERLRADPAYFFSDAYFEALAPVPHFLVCVEDTHGLAAAALFLHDEAEAYYHLGGRRDGIEPVVGAMSLALGEGIREAWRRGCRAAALGGGRSDRPDDPLLTFKRQLAPTELPRFTVALGQERPA